MRDGGVTLAGVATHGGHSYGAGAASELVDTAEQERSAVVEAAERLRAAGFAVPGVSAGSTPTAVHMARADGLTEIRAGVYMAGDLFQAGIGSLAEKEIAISVLASVIGHKPRGEPDRRRCRRPCALQGPLHRGARGGDLGYGVVLDVEGEPSLGRLVVGGVHQEHGEIRGARPSPSLACRSGRACASCPTMSA